MTLSVIILCGGKGTRIKSVLGPIPKVLAPIGDKAFIDYLFKWIESGLISIKHNIILSTCVGHESIQKYVDDKSLVCRLSKEKDLLGTLGAVIDVVKRESLEGHALILNGDTIFDINLVSAYNKFIEDTSHPLLIVKRSVESGRYGGYKHSAEGNIRFCDEDPEYISLGAFFCRCSDLTSFEGKVPTDPTKGKMLDIDFLDRSNIKTFILPKDVKFIDIGVPSDYKLAKQLIPTFFKS